MILVAMFYRFITILCGLIVGLHIPLVARAADYVVSGDTTTTNDGQFLLDGDTITVNSNVSVDVTGTTGASAISSSSFGVVATNNGTLRAGEFGTGITLFTRSTALNFGSIVTTSTGSYGIFMIGDDNTVFSTGSIATSGDAAHGIVLDGPGADVTVTGTIDVTGVGAVGVQFGGFGQDFGGNNFTTSGRITSTNGDAFRFDIGDGTVTINAPAFFEGRMVLGDDITGTFNLGASQSNHWVFDGISWLGTPTVNGDVPFVLLGNTIATVDPTQFVASYSAQAQENEAVNTLIGNRLALFNHAGGGNVTASTKYKSDPVFAPPIEPPAKSAFWISAMGLGARHASMGSFLGYGLGFGAVAAGADKAFNNNLLLGLTAGFSQAKYATGARFSRSQDISGEGGFFGLYGTRNFGKAYLNFSLVAGFRGHSSRRFINNNLVAGGIDIAVASYNSRYVSPALTLGRAYKIGSNFTITPSARLSHASTWIDGYSETGAAAALTVDARRLNMIEARAQIKAAAHFNGTKLTSTLGILGRSSFGGDSITGTLLAAPLSYATGTGADATAAYASLGIEQHFARNFWGAVSAETVVGRAGIVIAKAKASLTLDF